MLTAMVAAPSGVVLSVGGVIFELHPPLFGVLWAKAQSSSWTDNGDAIGVMASLEASLLEAQHSLELAAEGGDGDVQEDELQGGCQAHVMASHCFGDVQRLLHGCLFGSRQRVTAAGAA